MRLKIAILSVALGLLGAPIQGALAGDTCPMRCPPSADAPCAGDAAPCAPAVISCCDAAPALPLAPAKRTIDFPGFHLVATAKTRLRAPDPTPLPSSRSGERPMHLPSPLRLSVVLTI